MDEWFMLYHQEYLGAILGDRMDSHITFRDLTFSKRDCKGVYRTKIMLIIISSFCRGCRRHETPYSDSGASFCTPVIIVADN